MYIFIITYTYDTNGNLQTVTTYPFTSGTLGTATSTITYAYEDEEWGDLLTKYNGQTLTYDNIGNPLTWRDGMTMTWQDGRRLASLQTNGKNIQYTYDADGLRVTKTVDGTKYTYQYVGGQLMYETRGDISFSYEYDAYGNLSCLHYIQANGTSVTYYVVCNSRGDVTAIYNAAGTLQAKYSYDSWGNTLSITGANGNAVTSATHIGNLNMIRYRGYYFDSETGFYYLQSRYYDPQVKRFLNADGYVSTGQGLLRSNMFAYCGNNPVNRVDETGQGWLLAIAVLGILSLAVTLSGCDTPAETQATSKPSSPATKAPTTSTPTRTIAPTPSITTAPITDEQLAVAQTIYGEEHGYRTPYGEQEARKGQEGVATTIKNRYLNGDGSLVEIITSAYTGYDDGKLAYETGKLYQPAWNYALELAGYLCTGNYSAIPTNGLTTQTQFRPNSYFAKRYDEATGLFTRSSGQKVPAWDIVTLGGNTFFSY